MNYIRRYWGYLGMSIVLAAVTVALTLYLPVLTGRAVDLILEKGVVDFAGILAILKKMAVIILLTATAQWIMNACNNKITYHIIRDIRKEAFEKIERLPLKYIDGHSYGEIVSRVIADVDQFADGLLMGFTQFFTGIVTILGTLIFMLTISVLEYMKLTSDYLKSKGSDAKVILGGWGGGHQLPSLLNGLDRALPKDVIFSCLNPDLGKSPQPEFLSDIAKNRTVWAVPWLEGDHQLWHFQPRVEMMRDHVKLAAKQNLDGVIAIHWRTEEPRFNFRTFAHFASNKTDNKTVEQLYEEYLTEDMGNKAAKLLAPLLAQMDIKQIQWNVPSPEFYAFTPEWGLLDDQNVKLRESLIRTAEQVLKKTEGSQRDNLQRFIAMFRFELLLGEVDKAMMPAFILKKNDRQGVAASSFEEYEEAYRSLMAAPVKDMFETYMQRVHSRGELGVLSSLNQRLWREYNDLKSYLETKLKR